MPVGDLLSSSLPRYGHPLRAERATALRQRTTTDDDASFEKKLFSFSIQRGLIKLNADPLFS